MITAQTDMFADILVGDEQWHWYLHFRYLYSERDGWPKPIVRKRVRHAYDSCIAGTEEEARDIFIKEHGEETKHLQWLHFCRGEKYQPETLL